MDIGGVRRGKNINLMRNASISNIRKNNTQRKMKTKQIFIIEIF